MNRGPQFNRRIASTTDSRGLGYQMVRSSAERGADVVVGSRKLDNCKRVAQEAPAVPVHAARWDSIEALIEAADEIISAALLLASPASSFVDGDSPAGQ